MLIYFKKLPLKLLRYSYSLLIEIEISLYCKMLDNEGTISIIIVQWAGMPRLGIIGYLSPSINKNLKFNLLSPNDCGYYNQTQFKVNILK